MPIEEDAVDPAAASPPYPAARAVAVRVQSHFARHLIAERKRGRANLAPEPDAQTIEAVVDAAFWASLRREENFTPKISLAFVAPEQTGHPLLLEQKLPLAPESLTRLAPAVERPGIHLGVWRESSDRDLTVWGATRTLPLGCFVLEVIAPGLLVIKQRGGGESGKFVNVAVLEGDQVKVLNNLLDNDNGAAADSPPIIKALLGLDSAPAQTSLSTLVQLAVSMRKHGRGGSLLVVPPDSDAWRESVVRPISYSVMPKYSELAELMQRDERERHHRPWQQAITRVVDTVAGLTAVDGATVLTGECELLAFGAKIARRDGAPRVEAVIDSEPTESAEFRIVHPTQLGGTRHLSAAQFAQDQHDAVAMVASQDGRFTVFAWSPSQQMVHAYRVETLLL